MIDIKVKCRNCGTFTRIEDDDLKRIYEKGRADAIEECVNFVDEWDSVIAESLSKHMREQK